jgi:A/G-specific adenine glycosylase
MVSVAEFRTIIRRNYRLYGRHDMPWRKTWDPYHVLISEIMLQQTQVSRVAPFYEKFIKCYPNFRALARAKTSDVLRAWQGLGYNRRALALQRLAKEVIEKHGGRLPEDFIELTALPGIGNYTAGAIRTFAFDKPEIFIETNIRRVFIHFFFPRRLNVTDARLKRYIERTLDEKNPREWYYALMDYGAKLGEDIKNPNRRSAHYVRQSVFTGSDRQIRGKILRESLACKKITMLALAKKIKEPRARMDKIVRGLILEGFLKEKSGFLVVAD